MDNTWFIAAIWMGLALVASLVSVRLGIFVALVEIPVGVVAGNLPIAIIGHRISQFNSTVPPGIASPVMGLGRRGSVLWCGAFMPKILSPYWRRHAPTYSREMVKAPLLAIDRIPCGASRGVNGITPTGCHRRGGGPRRDP